MWKTDVDRAGLPYLDQKLERRRLARILAFAVKSDLKYFARRCYEEWVAAIAQARHVDLAIRYEELALKADAQFSAPPADFYDD